MPKQTTKSPLAGKLDGYIKAHKTDETVYSSGGNLPGGVEGGIAQLADLKIDTYKDGQMKGKPYFLAAGIVKSPKECNGIRIEGLRTQIMEPLCDTPTRKRATEEEHVAWMLNQIRLLGGENCLENCESEADLRDVMKTLVDEKINFRFRTWAGNKQELEERNGKFYVVQGKNENGPYKTAQEARAAFPYVGSEPMVNHEWGGSVSVEDSMTPDDIVDSTEVEEPTDMTEVEAEGGEIPDDEIPFEEEDLEALAEAADNGDGDAGVKLEKAAESAGIPKLQVQNAPDWASVVEAIRESQSSGEEESSEEEDEPATDEDWKPAKEEIWYYKPPKKRKAIEVEVTAVFEGKRVCNVKAVDGGETFRSVKWDDLKESAE